MSVLTTRQYSFESGTGANKYTFVVYVDSDDNLSIKDIATPTGVFNFDSGSLPESVIRDMDGALDTVSALL